MYSEVKTMQTFYTVRPGDTLYKIAKRWELPVESLIAANNIVFPFTIYVGQQLSMPPGVDRIRVQPGDTVYKISQRYGIPASVIIEANNLVSPFIIQANQLLLLPEGVPYYRVQSGDTLYQIARKFNVKTNGLINYELIRQVNKLPSTTIFPGMKLVIPYAPTGDGGVLAYTSNRGGTYEIWLLNPRTGISSQLTNGLGESFSVPYWSPNSGLIAFVGRRGILSVVEVHTGAVVQVDQVEGNTMIGWSPNSQLISYTKQNAIVVYNLVSHQSQRIEVKSPSDVQWFPNGVDLLFQAQDQFGLSQLYRFRTDGSAKQQLTSNLSGPIQHARLSPDGNFVLYTSPGASISIIYVIDLSSGIVSEVQGGPLAKNYYPEWSPQSSHIAYSATAFDDRGYYSLIRTTENSGENDRTWAISNCFSTPVTWSTDGRKVAYLSGCKNEEFANEIWILDLSHPVPIRVVEGVRIFSLKWSPTAIINDPTKVYTNIQYQVEFQYPGHWQRVDNERYEGLDGFFQISAIASDTTIDEVCHTEAYHQLIPYGSQPQILKARIQNQEACYIFPSVDQPPEMNNQAALIIRYPSPLLINGEIYQYFILWADQAHITDISQTIQFL